METYVKDFSMQSIELVKGGSDLEDLISLRQERFHLTLDHKETNDKIEDLLNKLEVLPEAKEIVRELGEEITWLKTLSYGAAYRDGMTDLMAALTLNKMDITAAECIKIA